MCSQKLRGRNVQIRLCALVANTERTMNAKKAWIRAEKDKTVEMNEKNVLVIKMGENEILRHFSDGASKAVRLLQFSSRQKHNVH